jgi:hypothetical protein
MSMPVMRWSPQDTSSVAARLHKGEAIADSGLTVSVPPPGRGLFAQALAVDGSITTLGVQTKTDGSVLVFEQGSLAGRVDPMSSSPSACADSAYSLYPTSWTKTYRWYFDATSTPSGLTQSAATGALKSAVNNITKANNDCGLPDLVSATNAYQGSTTVTPNISNTSNCLSGDGKSVVGFGTLSAIYVGYSCWWTVGNATVEADVKLNKTNYSWYVTRPAGCSSKWDVQAVATHEFGHVFGLLSLDEATHANLTMSQVIYACQSAEDTLGLGDVLGLQAKY